ncbi:MAG: hypothetical protein FGM27_09200 [Candidatus Omnitrophica bacterium]|nr:hypothetical protein [Candidatus Omnitrophota bacterium]
MHGQCRLLHPSTEFRRRSLQFLMRFSHLLRTK